MRIARILFIPAVVAFACGSTAPVVDSRMEREVFRPAEVAGRTIIADEIRLYPRDSVVARFSKRDSKPVRLISQDDDLFVDYGIYTPVEFMISQSDVIRIEVDRVVYLDHGPPAQPSNPGADAVAVLWPVLIVVVIGALFCTGFCK